MCSLKTVAIVKIFLRVLSNVHNADFLTILLLLNELKGREWESISREKKC